MTNATRPPRRPAHDVAPGGLLVFLEVHYMAITKVGPPLAGIRGTIGGITYSANGAGTYAKLWAPPLQPHSPKQQQQRSIFATWPAEWRALTQVQRDAWDTWAALPAQDLTNSLGETYSASGFNWFTKINTRLERVGIAMRVAPPILARPAAPFFDNLEVWYPAAVFTVRIKYGAGDFVPNLSAICFFSVVASSSQIHRTSSFFSTAFDNTPPNQFWTVTPDFEPIFGQTTPGSRAFCRLYRQTGDGLRSAAATKNVETA